MRTRLPAALGAVAALLTAASAATAAPPAPFGHACAPREGALLCPTASDVARGTAIATRRSPGFTLLGRDAPTYRSSNGSFGVTVSRLRVVLPTRECRPR
jgi:hypothetical protein